MGFLIVAAGAALGGGWYAALCAMAPFQSCKQCSGMGRFPVKTRKTWRPCDKCEGDGRHLRAGRKAYNAWVDWRATRRARAGR